MTEFNKEEMQDVLIQHIASLIDSQNYNYSIEYTFNLWRSTPNLWLRNQTPNLYIEHRPHSLLNMIIEEMKERGFYES